jgi:quinol monooxygenase YgiN
MISRRELSAGLVGISALGACARDVPQGDPPMYGLIGKTTAVAGKRDELIEVLLQEGAPMPGCLSYIVAKDPVEADAIWITEVWDSAESHKASLQLPRVKEAIAKGRPLIAGFGPSYETAPVGGIGLPKA